MVGRLIFSIFALLILSISASPQNTSPVSVSAGSDCLPGPDLSPEAKQVAEAIRISAQIENLRSHLCDPPSTEQIALRQQVVDRIFLASLEIDGVVGQIDAERAQILESRTLLANRQSHRVNVLTLANLAVSAGSGILTNAMQFGSSGVAYAGDAVGIGGGAAGALLSLLGMRVTGGTTTIEIEPNMLAAIFEKKPEEHSVYPSAVWEYLNTTPADYPLIQQPWRQDLIQHWIKEHRIDPPDTAKSAQKLHQLTSQFAEHTRVSLEVLVDRSLMLLDLRGRVLLMKSDLRYIVCAVIPARTSGLR